jgi:hypothetical protein
MKVEIRPDTMHPATHRLVTIEHRGRVYGVRWARPFPTEEQVLETWARDRQKRTSTGRTFLPYDKSTDTFDAEWRKR